MRGHVLFLNGNYGFIRADDHTEIDADIFFHVKDVVGEGLYSGAYVEFELANDKNRVKAVNVTELIETEDGLTLIKVKLFNMVGGAFDLYDFYLQVISKINIGLRYATTINDTILASSVKISEAEALEIIEHKDCDHSEIIEGHKVKFL